MKNVLLVVMLSFFATKIFAQNVPADTTAKGLPVLKSYVAPDAVERAKKKYGRALYSIEKSTAANCLQSYLVGLIRNGKLTLEWMCDDPKLAQLMNEKMYPKRDGKG